MKFKRTYKRYIYKPKSVFENKMHKILWDFEIQKDHQIPTRSPDQKTDPPHSPKKRPCCTADFAVLADHQMKIKENEKRDKTMGKLRNMKLTVIQIVTDTLWTIPKELVWWLEEITFWEVLKNW